MNADPSAGAHLVGTLRALEARLAQTAARVVAATPDPEAVHDLRVAVRRTRSVLETGRAVLGPFHADEVRAALREVQRATGALRDEEVLLELVASLAVPDEDVKAWLETRRVRERRLRRALVRLVTSGALDRGRVLLDAMLAFRTNPRRDRRLSKFARRAVLRARRRSERLRMAPLDDAAALHELRIAYKRLRYVVETFAGVLPPDLAELARTASRLQTRLGTVHDIDVAVGSVLRARSLTDEGRRHLLAALERRREEGIAAYVREAGLIVPDGPRAAQAVGLESLRKISTR
ncbi:MAG: CHAD domain-containing protein [Myxococcales bacterium]|nr:CHAD domain-containing protein [Myxococcales bacterium]